MLCKHLKTTGKDWYLYVNPSCYAFSKYVSPSTGYSAFEVVYLHKPAYLTHIGYIPVHHLSRPLDDCMKIMKREMSCHEEGSL